jgi:hypothetical protein
MFDFMHLYMHREKGRRGFVAESNGQENITSISSIYYLLKPLAEKNQFEVIIVRVALGVHDPDRTSCHSPSSSQRRKEEKKQS